MVTHGEFVVDMFCVVKDAGESTSEQEQMGELGLDSGDDVFMC